MATSSEIPQETIGLDQALQALHEKTDDPKRQSQFYDIFLNTTFYVPSLDREKNEIEATIEEGKALPLIVESEGNDYLMLFDTEERMKNWAGADVKWVQVPGYVLAATVMPPLHMAMNVGTDYTKQFLPDEIAWLREVVERCNEAMPPQEQPHQ